MFVVVWVCLSLYCNWLFLLVVCGAACLILFIPVGLYSEIFWVLCWGLMMALTDTKLKGLKPFEGKRPKKYAGDGGLYAYHYPTGKVTFIFRYSVMGKQRDLKLGAYGKAGLTLKQANEKRDQCSAWLEQGLDPANELKMQRAQTLAPITVRQALDQWLDDYALEKRKNAIKHRQQFNKWIYPWHGDSPLSGMKQAHWLECFRNTNKSLSRPAPVAATYTLQMVKQALRRCRRLKYDFDYAEIEHLTVEDVGGKRAEKRERTLISRSGRDWSELQTLVRWLGDFREIHATDYYPLFVALNLIFGCRSGEIRQAKPNHFDFKHLEWKVPKQNSKTGNEIVRPIPAELKDWLKAVIDHNKPSGYVLGELKQPEAVSAWCRGIYKRAGISEPFTAHDIRRTVATGWADMGIAQNVIESELGHELGGVAGTYNLAQYSRWKDEALTLWLARLDALRADNVAILPTTRPA
ncbi:site-specific integrase [Aeromonas caviae]|uniref:tyrosine-type recombinase/integrase n=1 Tax=Aeromonas caviae TaxID=648 RepID=UPI001EF0E32E|nr:site-specific integrase [Aeromonas caviae]ULH01821.1 site-specific integrase [Aeromonas caviae]